MCGKAIRDIINCTEYGNLILHFPHEVLPPGRGCGGTCKMILFPASANPNLGEGSSHPAGAPLRTVVVGKKQEFPVSPVDPLAFPETGDWGSPLLRTPPPGLAASLAPRNGRAHSRGSAERVLIRRPLLPTFQLREEGWGMGQASRQTDRLSVRAHN